MIPELLRDLNSFHRSIQFTVENEVNLELPYLDVLLTRNADG